MSEEQRTYEPNDHCRAALVEAQPGATTHAGLWFDKFFSALEEWQPVKADQRKWELADMMAALPAPQLYAAWYKRWEAALTNETLLAQAEDYHVISQALSVQGRMVIGLGADAPLENSITLHRTYGVPYIPGSALKGLAASYAYNRLAASDWWADPAGKADRKGNSSAIYKTLFGTTEEAGFITFFDALYIPGSAPNDRPLVLDVLTVHHQNYYQGDAPPADWDSPIPVPFLSAVGSYLVALAGPKLWVTVVQNLLRLALADAGIGAKTSSGYGRMQLAARSRLLEGRSFEQPKRRQEIREQAQSSHDSGKQRTQHGTMQQRQPITGQRRVTGVIKSMPPGLNYGYIRLDDDQGRGDARFYFDRVTSGTARVGQRVTCQIRLVQDRWRAEDVHVEE
jgi:CRISPR-associated protein Cmr6